VISIVVPVHNAGHYLGELLGSLASQENPGPWEIVLVDNLSTDDSLGLADPYRDRLPLKTVTASARANPAYARNVGAQNATGDKLLFVDADDAIDPGYVSAMSKALEVRPLVTSRVDSERLNPEWTRKAYGLPWQADAVQVLFDFMPAAGINIGIDRDLYFAIGGFPEEFSGSEDVAFCWKAQLETGASLRFVADAVYCYRYRTTLPKLFMQAANWGRDSVLLYKTFRSAGMPARPLSAAITDWTSAIAGALQTTSSEARAQYAVRLGFCVGRLRGSLQYRASYF
jgi:glycosyltransferase involved in cell wall biosynthesis